nr:MAG TPA: hypothetical protein [Caudoviricetes sp.]
MTEGFVLSGAGPYMRVQNAWGLIPLSTNTR